MIPKLISSGRVNDVSAVAINICNSYDKENWESDSNMLSIFTLLKNKSKSLSIAIKKNKTESKMDELDNSRDYNVRALHYLIQGAIYNPDGNIKNAGEQIYSVFSKYGCEITSLNYGAETAQITSLLIDLSAGNLQDSISKIPGCDNCINNLKTAQQNFENAYVDWEETRAKENLEVSSSEYKKEVLHIINGKIVIYLRAMKEMDEATYGDFANTIAKIISETNEIIKRRGKKEKEEDKEIEIV